MHIAVSCGMHARTFLGTILSVPRFEPNAPRRRTSDRSGAARKAAKTKGSAIRSAAAKKDPGHEDIVRFHRARSSKPRPRQLTE